MGRGNDGRGWVLRLWYPYSLGETRAIHAEACLSQCKVNKIFAWVHVHTNQTFKYYISQIIEGIVLLIVKVLIALYEIRPNRLNSNFNKFVRRLNSSKYIKPWVKTKVCNFIVLIEMRFHFSNNKFDQNQIVEMCQTSQIKFLYEIDKLSEYVNIVIIQLLIIPKLVSILYYSLMN